VVSGVVNDDDIRVVSILFLFLLLLLLTSRKFFLDGKQKNEKSGQSLGQQTLKEFLKRERKDNEGFTGKERRKNRRKARRKRRKTKENRK